MFIVMFSLLLTLLTIVFLIGLKFQNTLAIRVYDWLEERLAIAAKLCIVAVFIPILNVAFITTAVVILIATFVLDQINKITKDNKGLK